MTLQRFVERLRADDDWVGLYGRLAPRSAESALDVSLSSLAADPALPSYPPAAYYPNFTVPPALGTVTVLVQVPARTVAGKPALVEDLAAPRYGLPADLDGDGAVDAKDHSSDARALPLVVRLRWARPGQGAHEIVVATRLRKDS